MEHISTTQTAIDRMEKIRILNVEIVKLVSLRDIANRETNDALQAAGDATQRIKKLAEQEEAAEKNILTLFSYSHDTFNKCQEIIKKYLHEIENGSTILSELGKKITEGQDKLSKIEKTANDFHTKMVVENENIEQKKKDLDIYRSRIKKYFDIHLPGQNIDV